MAEDEVLHEAFEAALDFLSRSARSEKEVKEKLYKKGYHRDAVDATLEKLKYYHYIDDAQYVKTYLGFYGAKYGKKQLEYKLTNEKGVAKQLVNEILDDALTREDEIEKCASFAQKYVAKKKLGAKDKSKLANFLYGKGFEWEIINTAVAAVDFGENGVDFD